jgi:hypothetical protein
VRASPALLALLLGTAVLLAAAPRARADDAAPAAGPGAVSRLTAEEAEFLRRRFPDWDQKDAAERDRLAANVLRLRSLSPEERARLLERVRRAERAGLLGTGELSERVAWWREHGADVRRRALQGHAATRAIAGGIVRSLPEEARRALQAKDGPAALSPLHRAAVETAIVSAWWKRATESLAAAPPLDAVPAPDAPPRESAELVRLRDETSKRGGGAAPAELRRAFAGAVVRDRVGAAVRAALGPARPAAPSPPPLAAKEREAALVALSAALRERFPAAHEGLVRDLAGAAGKGPEALVQWAWQQERAAPRSPLARARRLHAIAETLESGRDVLRGSADLLRRSDDLQSAILADLGVPEADRERLREARSPFERQRILGDLRRRFLSRARPLPPGPRRGPGDAPGADDAPPGMRADGR